MPRSIGLDVGTHAVRAAEVSFGRGRPVLRRFGQVAVPHGAVVAGEVVDAPAVSAAIRRLWREGGFSGKRVSVGVGGARAVARTAEVPFMADDELRSALQFQVQELIPIPMEDAVLDYQVIERLVLPDGQEQLRVFVVAAHRDMIRSLLAALEGAGLAAERIDLVPFALIRGLYLDRFDLGDGDGMAPGGAEAIVGVGGGVTNIVVHDRGTPRFVRTLTAGGTGVAEAVSSELGIDIDAAEHLKRTADPLSGDATAAQVAQVVAGAMTPLVEDIRSSLDYFLTQSEGGLRRVTVTGGGSRLPDLVHRLGEALQVPVGPGDTFEVVEAGRTGLPEDVLRGAVDLLAVPVGLALGADRSAGVTRLITLLPAEIGMRARERRQVAMAGVGVAAFAALLFGVFTLRGATVADAEEEADITEAATADLQTQVAILSPAGGLEADLSTRRTSVQAVLASDVSWAELLQEMATSMPDDVWLTSFNATSGAGTGPGTVTVAGTGFDQTSSARWLLEIDDVAALDQVWLPSSTTAGEGDRPLVSFSSTGVLTADAVSDRADRYAEGQSS